MNDAVHIFVFTDLDGTFLDHHTYDYAAALPAVTRLEGCGAVIIPTTSKTIAEIDALNLPFAGSAAIAENGMVIRDNNETHAADKTYGEITVFINALPNDLRQHITGFNDMSVSDVVTHTGLAAQDAALAKTRLGSEPFLWSGDEKQLSALKEHIAANGLNLTQGGRFYHLMSNGGKDKAMEHVLKSANPNAISIALGDGPNDAGMLAAADYGVQIPNENGHNFDIPAPKGQIIRARAAGPTGWADAINTILNDLKIIK